MQLICPDWTAASQWITFSKEKLEIEGEAMRTRESRNNVRKNESKSKAQLEYMIRVSVEEVVLGKAIYGISEYRGSTAGSGRNHVWNIV